MLVYDVKSLLTIQVAFDDAMSPLTAKVTFDDVTSLDLLVKSRSMTSHH